MYDYNYTNEQLESIKKQQKKIDDVKLFKPIAVTQSK